jgi:hypothetical protein
MGAKRLFFQCLECGATIIVSGIVEYKGEVRIVLGCMQSNERTFEWAAVYGNNRSEENTVFNSQQSKFLGKRMNPEYFTQSASISWVIDPQSMF